MHSPVFSFHVVVPAQTRVMGIAGAAFLCSWETPAGECRAARPGPGTGEAAQLLLSLVDGTEIKLRRVSLYQNPFLAQ